MDGKLFCEHSMVGISMGNFLLISIVGNFIVVVAQQMEEKTHEFWGVVEVILPHVDDNRF